jgi:hypothetical protein
VSFSLKNIAEIRLVSSLWINSRKKITITNSKNQKVFWNIYSIKMRNNRRSLSEFDVLKTFQKIWNLPLWENI